MQKTASPFQWHWFFILQKSSSWCASYSLPSYRSLWPKHYTIVIKEQIVYKMEKSLNFPIMQGLTEHTARPWPVLTFCSNKLIRPLYLALYTLFEGWINIFLFLSSIFVRSAFNFSSSVLAVSDFHLVGSVSSICFSYVCTHT